MDQNLKMRLNWGECFWKLFNSSKLVFDKFVDGSGELYVLEELKTR